MAANRKKLKKRALDGNASNDQALEMGALVEPLASAATALISDSH